MTSAAHIAAVAGVVAATLTPVLAQDQSSAFRPLEEIVSNGAQKSVLSLHCAGLFHSVWDFMGEEILGAAATKQATDNATLFLDAGVTLRATETGSTEADISEAAIAEAFAVSGLYYARYRTNVAEGRDAFATDETWNADLQICRNLAAQL